MPARRKYWNPGSTTVKAEKWKLTLLDSLKIDHTEAFNRGLDEILQVSMEKGRVQSEFLEHILSEKRAELDKLQTTIKLLEDALQGTLIPEAADKKRKEVINQLCSDTFGNNLRGNMRKLPENDPSMVYVDVWLTLARIASEEFGSAIKPKELQQCLRNMISDQLNQEANTRMDRLYKNGGTN